MAFVSTAMLISRPDPHRKSLMMSLHNELKSLCKPFSSIGMVRPRKCVAPVSMSFIEDAAGAKRRIGSHHCNIWDDDVIHSLSTPYGAPSYRERAEVLIKEVRNMFNSISSADGELNALVLQRLWMVDNVERLGIDRHFKYEIKAALDFVYSCWNETGIGCDRDSILPDLNSTALALRTLRLHGYTVSSDVLENFKSENGQFACFALKTEGKSELRGILNLFRASSIAFPGEKIMEEAQIFSKKYLKEAIQEIPVSHLSLEMEYILEYGWQTNLPRLEARNYIEVFGQDSLYISAPCINIEILLELAKLEFNIFHSIQLRELQCLSRWWTDSDLPQVTFARHRHVEFYCLASCIALDPKHSAFRLGFAKSCHIATVLDDIYDTYGTISELQLFTEAVRRWDPSAIERHPEYMKGVYMVLYEAVNEMAREAKKMQGRDTLNYARKAWEAQLDAVMQEAEWIASNYMPTFEEYFNNAKVSFGYRIATLQPILTLDIPLPHHILEQIDFPSRFNELAWSMLRLRGDTRTYKVEMARGEEASSISCYMKDNPGSTEEDALNHINTMIDDIIKELNWEFLRPDSNVPISSKKHAFEISRAIHHLYKDRDGYSVADGETKNFVMRTMLEPVPM